MNPYLAEFTGTALLALFGDGVVATGPGIRSLPSDFLCEAIGAATLLFGALAIPSAASLFPARDGIQASVRYLSAGWFCDRTFRGGPTGYAINPARDFGPRLMHALLSIAGKGGSIWSRPNGRRLQP